MEKFFSTSLNLTEAVQKALKHIKGAYAIVTFSIYDPEIMVCAKLSSPLHLGISENEVFVASDVHAILEYTRDIITLEDKEIATISHTGYSIRSLENGDIHSKEVEHINWDTNQIEKAGYAHFMLKEIFEEPDAVLNALRGRIDHAHGTAILGGLSQVSEKLRHLKRLQIVSCGTAYYAGLYGKYIIEELAKIPVSVDIASEYRYRNNPPIGTKGRSWP